MIKKTLLFGSLTMLLTGCIGGKTYLHPNYTPQKWAVDKAECNAFARGAYGYSQPHQIQNNNPKQYDIRGTSYNNYVGSANYYGTIKEKYDYKQGINNMAKGMMNVRYQNNINEAFKACLFQKGWRLNTNTSSAYNSNGYDRDGYDVNGYGKDGKDRDGYYPGGFNDNGINKYTGTKFDNDGYDKDGYNRDGYNHKGYDRLGLNKNGINSLGFDKNGFGKDGYDKDGYNKDGFDWDGFNREGYDKNGIHMNDKFRS